MNKIIVILKICLNLSLSEGGKVAISKSLSSINAHILINILYMLHAADMQILNVCFIANFTFHFINSFGGGGKKKSPFMVYKKGTVNADINSQKPQPSYGFEFFYC